MKILPIFLIFVTIVAQPIPSPTMQYCAFRGTEKIIVVQLRTESGLPITNATVFFFHETNNHLLGSSITNQTGHVQYHWYIPSTHELGPVLLNATFYGDPERFLLPSSITIPITIFGQMNIITKTTDSKGNPIDSSISPGQTLIFNVTIYNDLKQPLDGISVQLLNRNGKIIMEDTTTQNGFVLFTYLCPLTQFSEMLFIIRSLDHGYYNGTTSQLQFPIKAKSTMIVGLPSFFNLGEDTNLEGNLCTIFGTEIPNVSINLYSESAIKMAETLTNENGKFCFDLAQNQAEYQKRRFIIIRFDGMNGLKSSQALVGIVPSTANNPFIQTIDHILPLNLSSILLPLGLITLCCITLSSGIYSLKMNRYTRKIVSH